MAISNNSTIVTLVGNGTEDEFVFPFKVFDDADVRVFIDGVLQTIVTDYTVTIDTPPDEGGTVTFTAPPALNAKIIIRRNVAEARTTDFQQLGSFAAVEINKQLDIITANIQELDDEFTRCIRLDEGDTGSSLVIPTVRANKYLGFGPTGDAAVLDAPIISTTPLIVVQGTDPGHVNGRLWVDTGTTDRLIMKYSDGVDHIEAFRIDTSGNKFFFFASDTLLIESANASVNAAPVIDLYRKKVTPADNDFIGGISMNGDSDTGNKRLFGYIHAKTLDVSDTTEDGEVHIGTMVAGTSAARAVIGQGLYMNGVTGGDKGTGSINATEVHVRGNGLGKLTVKTVSASTYTVVADDLGSILRFTNGAGCTVTMGLISGLGTGFRVKLVNASGGNVLVQRSGSDTIDPSATAVTIQNTDGCNEQDWFNDGIKWRTSRRRFRSGLNAISNGGTFSATHGLGAMPLTSLTFPVAMRAVIPSRVTAAGQDTGWSAARGFGTATRVAPFVRHGR